MGSSDLVVAPIGGLAATMDGQQVWGFWDVHLKDERTLLVHTTYTARSSGVVISGFAWSRIDT